MAEAIIAAVFITSTFALWCCLKVGSDADDAAGYDDVEDEKVVKTKCKDCDYKKIMDGKGNPNRWYCHHPEARFARSECEPVPMICRTKRHSEELTIKNGTEMVSVESRKRKRLFSSSGNRSTRRRWIRCDRYLEELEKLKNITVTGCIFQE